MICRPSAWNAAKPLHCRRSTSFWHCAASGAGRPLHWQVDSETGDILRDQRVMLLPGGLGQMPVTTLYEDYRDTDQGRTPFRSIESNEATGRTVYETESIEFGVEPDPDLFRFPPPYRE